MVTMMCDACGFDNYPCDEVCGHCRRTLLEGEELADARRKWETLEPRSQVEFLEGIARRQMHFLEYLHVLRKKRRIHTVVGALLAGAAQIVNPLIFVFTGSVPAFLVHVLPDVAFGGLAAYRLNCRDGGASRGAWYFCLAAIGGLTAKNVLMIHGDNIFPHALASQIPRSPLQSEPIAFLILFIVSLIPVWTVGALLGYHIEHSGDFWRSSGWYTPAIPPDDENDRAE